MTIFSQQDPRSFHALDLDLKVLSIDQIRQVDEALASLGEYGEVHLVVKHGEVRYINVVESYKAWRSDTQT